MDNYDTNYDIQKTDSMQSTDIDRTDRTDRTDRSTRRNLRGDRPSGIQGFGHYAEQSPDEVKETMKTVVSKGVAIVAGALDGFNEQMDEGDVAVNARKAVENLGEAAANIVDCARSEAVRVKEAFVGHGLPDKGGEMGKDAWRKGIADKPIGQSDTKSGSFPSSYQSKDDTSSDRGGGADFL